MRAHPHNQFAATVGAHPDSTHELLEVRVHNSALLGMQDRMACAFAISDASFVDGQTHRRPVARGNRRVLDLVSEGESGVDDIGFETSNPGKRISHDMTLDSGLCGSVRVREVAPTAPGGMGRACGSRAVGRRANDVDHSTAGERLLLGGQFNNDLLPRQASGSKHHTTAVVSSHGSAAVGGSVESQCGHRE